MEIDHALFLFCGRSSKDIQLRELKDMINDLKKMIKTLQATVDAAKAENLEALLPERTAKKRKARATDAERFKGVPVEKNKEKESYCLAIMKYRWMTGIYYLKMQWDLRNQNDFQMDRS